ncbi:DNA-binding CsgD family transcriptional regulator [Microvirga flocculans]|uniref:DNA-binding CsgD family transcriptional regulator n=1 Tax=Microvirga flocculans TaxID=217168 RepID=A0A7W6IC31_9HYPH|nr:helix-turn-helix transcriptional regulator [Microvirga flocculans]MBB4038721.1 DNA-binding CsgD family transcriptional regulator [Microvirga flocculans]
MYVSKIDAAQSLPYAFQAALGDLIEAVGRPNFAETLFRTTRSATGCDQLIVFTGVCGQAPKTAIMQGIDAPIWRNERYVNDYWRVDPIRLVELELESSGASLALIEARDLSSAEYRDDCFTEANLYSRASTCRNRDGRMVRFNLYFKDRRAFDPIVSQYLSDTSELMDVLLRRHGIHGERTAHRLGQQNIADRLRVVAPELTQRELQVCTHIARGLTSEGIALELGISLNTVLTYRKRAYSRLNICTQNELLQLLVS